MACMTFTEFLGVKLEVRQAISILSGFPPDSHIAIRFYDQDEICQNVEGCITDNQWQAVCEQYEQNETIDQMSADFLLEKAESFATPCENEDYDYDSVLDR